MTTEHPITPPTELVQQWYTEADNQLGPYYDYIATQAVRWGADQELRACHELLDVNGCPSKWLDMLCAARRPKPPSLAEQALTKINAILGDPRKSTLKDEIEALELSRHALERLKELEQQENNDN